MRRALPLICLLAFLPGLARPADAQQSGREQVLIELQAGRLAAQTMPALRAGDAVLLPVAQFLEFAEMRVARLPDGGVESSLEPQNIPLLVPARGDSLRLGGKPYPLAPGALVNLDGTQYLDLAVLAQLLGLRTSVNWQDLAVTIFNPDQLPVGRRILREAQRAALARATQSQEPDLTLPLERRTWNGLVMDYSLLTPSADPLGGGAFSTGLGMDLFGGSFELGLASQGDGIGGRARADVSWNGVWRESRWFTQLHLGDAVATGPRSRSVRGFAVSNAPYARPGLLGTFAFEGDLGPGWQIEAYRGGRLIAFDSVNALGRFSVDVPVRYGENPVEFVAYGPFGEVRRFSQTWRAADGLLPEGRLEYGLSAGACRTPLCAGTANLDVRYGLNRRWTVETGMDQFWRDSLGNLSHPYLGITGNLRNAWTVELEGVLHAIGRAALNFEPSAALRLRGEYTTFATGPVAPILTAPGRRNQWTLDATLRPADNGPFYLDGSLEHIVSAGGSLTGARVGAALQLQQIRLMPALRIQRESPTGAMAATHGYLSLNTFVLPRPGLGRLLGQVSARSTLDMEAPLRPVSASAYLSRPLRRDIRVEAGLGWTRGIGTSVSLVFSTTLPTVQAYSTLSAPSRGPATATQYVRGSVLYDPQSRNVAFSSQPAVQRAGVSGRIFLDLNGNGVLDGAEPTVPGVRLRVGTVLATSDSDGTYRVWDVLPYEPVLLVVDSLSMPSPLWVPAFANASIEPGPNEFRSLDIPLLPGGVLDGQVQVPAEAGQRAGGIPLLLKERRTGAVRRLVTFSDGEFYAIGIKPGAYELSVDPDVLKRSGLEAAPLHFTMAALPDGASITGLVLALRTTPNR